jgi:hypothetical protein
MNNSVQFQLIDRFLRHSLSKNESKQLRLLRKDPDFEEPFLLMLELRSALRQIKLSEKLAYLKHLELSLHIKPDEKPSVSLPLKALINQINNKLQLLFIGAGLKLIQY